MDNTLPSWYEQELVLPYRANIAHAFLLHGNIWDLVSNPDAEDEIDQPYVPFRAFLEKIFDGRDMVIFYNIASGIRFLRPDMEKRFRKIAGLDADDIILKDPIAAAKAELAAKRGIPREPDACLVLIEKVLRGMPGAAVIINSVHFIAPAASGGIAAPLNERANIERLRNWSQDEELRKNKAIILFLVDQAAKVSEELRQSGSEIQTIFIPKPTKEERKLFIQLLTQKSAKPKKLKSPDKAATPRFIVPKNFDANVFAHATQGMGLRQILEILLHSKKTEKPISLEYVKEKKREILNAEYGDVMEIIEPQRGLEDIGGLACVKEFFRNLLDAIRKGEERLVAMGVTLMGPPGTGKTALVEALAKEAGFNFVRTKNIRSMWVGESEARMQKYVYGLRALAPVVVMNDEADLANADRNSPKGDSGVSERLMKMWMELLSDPKIRGQIIVISCTNRPDRLDPALKRSGRSDERILIPMPTCEEVPEIFQVMFKRHAIPTAIADLPAFAKMVEGFSGADLEKIALNAFRFAVERGKKTVDDATLREAIEDFIPSASQLEIDRMTLAGILESSSRRLLPPHTKEIVTAIKARNLVENLAETLEQIRARNIVDIEL